MLLLLRAACARSTAPPTPAGSSDMSRPFAQSPDAPLAGTAYGIAYSGYRLGQHPDRGTAEIAPTVDRVIALAQSHPDIVIAVNVGNEALVSWNDHMVSVEALLGYITKVKQAIDQPVTTTANDVARIEHAARLGDLDFAMVHTYPQWEGRTVDEAMAFSFENLKGVRDAGWATEASEFGARATEADQSRYLNELMAWADAANVTTFVFEAFDEPWKGNPDNPAGAEKHWGLFTVDRAPKAWVPEQER